MQSIIFFTAVILSFQGFLRGRRAAPETGQGDRPHQNINSAICGSESINEVQSMSSARIMAGLAAGMNC